MNRFLLFATRRLLLLVPIMLVVSFLVFLVLRLGPVDPAFAFLLNSRIPATPEAVELTRTELGLNAPLLSQYISWLKGAVQLDFGNSYTTGRAAFKDLMYYFPTTMKLTGVSMVVVVLLSIPLGMLSALRRNKPTDKIVRFLSFIGVSTPNFWVGYLLIYLFSVKFNLLPAFGESGPLSYIMPVLTLSLMSIAINTRLSRTSFLEHMNMRSVQYARARGLSERTVMGKYVLKNSFIPIITSLGMHFGELLGGAVVVETLFAWPGVGRYIVGAITNHDYPVIQCFMIVMTTVFVLCNLITDIIYAYLNPKIWHEVE